MFKSIKGITIQEVLIVLAVFSIVAFILVVALTPPIMGLPPFGEIHEYKALVQSKHVDYNQDSGSSYMVQTDKGVFEVNNSLWLWSWNADEVYGSIEVGKTYTITTKGRKCLNVLFQKYPYIIKVK